MSSRRFKPSAQPLKRAQSMIRAQHREDAERFRGAIVGRPLSLPHESDTNRKMLPQLPTQARYFKIGQLAAVYLYRHELRAHRGTTFFNSAQVNMAIEKLGDKATRQAVISRGDLAIVTAPFNGSEETKRFWLTAVADRAHYVSAGKDKPPLDLRYEELTIANDLFFENMNRTGAPFLWLGAISAKSYDDACETLDPLEDIIPTQIQAGSIKLLPDQTR